MKRRVLLGALGVASIMAALVRTGGAAQKSTGYLSLEEIHGNWQSLLAEGADVARSVGPLERSEEEWRNMLEPEAFEVLREEGTERPFSSPLNDEKRPGVYVCAGCRLPLFTSAMKYDSGTGWPSFFTHVPDSLGTKRDWKLILPRTEYHCVRCGGHQGHVFDDGPPPTGERWCNNGVALDFIPKG
ncbi:MAG: peptide-methionine (R)-S-oxide reductase MsrB [Gammaproteobacteria bacterium]|nr:peptide-methionine (R)-S-oxide reductase MsrB [Gammaproteobacteria bacterium]